MRKRFLMPVMVSAVFFAACGGGDKKTEQAKSETTTPAADNSMVSGGGATKSKGEELISQKDCKTCHKEEMKLVGPAYKDVANKYEANDKNIDMLADKVIKGGSGNWGEVAMLPHPDISKDDAKEMVKYILSIGK